MTAGAMRCTNDLKLSKALLARQAMRHGNDSRKQ